MFVQNVSIFPGITPLISIFMDLYNRMRAAAADPSSSRFAMRSASEPPMFDAAMHNLRRVCTVVFLFYVQVWSKHRLFLPI